MLTLKGKGEEEYNGDKDGASPVMVVEEKNMLQLRHYRRGHGICRCNLTADCTKEINIG